MFNNIYKKIFQKIKKYDKIVITRHVGPDPDGLASQLALRDLILDTFPNKKVYAVGFHASKFRYLGELDKFNEELYNDALLIVLDTPDKKRVDGVDASRFKDSIKIDHHPFIEKFCELEWIDDSASSACQMVSELAFATKLKMSTKAAEKLFVGIVADTNRFLFYYTTAKTFTIVSKLIKYTNEDFTKLYEPLYSKSIKEVKFQGYIANNLTITENGLAYLKISQATLKDFQIDSATARNSVANFNYVDEIIAWAILTEEDDGEIKGSIRSRGPIINKDASKFNGGGHIYASGVRFLSEDDVIRLIETLDNTCRLYKEEKK